MLRRRNRSQSERSKPPSSVLRAGLHPSSSSDMTMICAWVAAGGRIVVAASSKSTKPTGSCWRTSIMASETTRVAP